MGVSCTALLRPPCGTDRELLRRARSGVSERDGHVSRERSLDAPPSARPEARRRTPRRSFEGPWLLRWIPFPPGHTRSRCVASDTAGSSPRRRATALPRSNADRRTSVCDDPAHVFGGRRLAAPRSPTSTPRRTRARSCRRSRCRRRQHRRAPVGRPRTGAVSRCGSVGSTRVEKTEFVIVSDEPDLRRLAYVVEESIVGSETTGPLGR